MRKNLNWICVAAVLGFSLCFAQETSPEELDGQFLPPEAATPAFVPATEQKQCEKKHNVNELLFKIKNSFPTHLKNCAQTLAKDMMNPFGKKLEPKSFMLQCPIDGIKKELPDGFPDLDKVIGSLTNFVQGLLNSASAGGALDPKKLVSVVGSMNVEELLSAVKKIATDYCVVDEPYEPPATVEEVGKPAKTSFWVAVGLDVLGAAMIGYAMYENGAYRKYMGSYDVSRDHYEAKAALEKAEAHKNKRDMFYVFGGLVLASGIGVHIWF